MKTAAKYLAAAYAGGAVVWLGSSLPISLSRGNRVWEPKIAGAIVGTTVFWPLSLYYALEDAI
jgi:hypothetical protein